MKNRISAALRVLLGKATIVASTPEEITITISSYTAIAINNLLCSSPSMVHLPATKEFHAEVKKNITQAHIDDAVRAQQVQQLLAESMLIKK